MNKKKILTYLLAGSFPLGTICEAKTVKIMFAYTSSAKNYHGGSKKIKAKLGSQFSAAKRLFVTNNRKSGISLHPGPKFETSYNHKATSRQQLDRLSGKAKVKGKTVINDVRRKRNQSKSDLVQLVSNNSDSDKLAGRGNIGGPFSNLARQNLRLWGKVSNNGSHEFGHNFNGIHSHGYCVGGKQRTIMERGCTGNARINHFSHPSFKKGKHRLGRKGKDNRGRVIRHHGKVSKFR